MKQTAEVEFLTASVSVVKVGNKQVTKSIYQQLDFVDLDDMMPWGRVRPGTRWTSAEPLYVIGADVSGRLVRSKVWPSHEHWFDCSTLPLIILAGLR